MMHLLYIKKGFLEKYFCLFAHKEPYVPYDTMVEKMIGSTSSSSNVNGIVDDNRNPYRNMFMDAMRMNQGYANEYPIVDEEPNTDTTRFFELLKDSDEPLWDGCINHSKLSVVAHVFIIKSVCGLSKAGYDEII
jgi:hypothetical protein